MNPRLVAPVLVLLLSGAEAMAETPIQESRRFEIGYPSKEAALEALSQIPDITRREQNDWIVFTDNAEHSFWSITAEGHPANPTVVKRTLVERDGGVSMEMRVKCGASKELCDQVVTQFVEMNRSLERSMRR